MISKSRKIFLLSIVDVEEVRVQDGLNHAGNYGNRIIKLGNVIDVSVNPIGNVQRPICTERKEVVSSDRLRFTSSLQHEELRKYSDRLKPDGEGPKYLWCLSVLSKIIT